MAFVVNDVELSPEPKTLLFDKHVEYIANHANDQNDYEYCMIEFLRMFGIYWGVTALDIMDHLPEIDQNSIVDFIKKCQYPISDFISPCEGHDSHVLYTLSVVQILCMKSCFFGDRCGKVDTRFSFCAVAILTLIKKMDMINLPKAIEFVMSCCNLDGGFGLNPHAESLAGLIYCCVGFLSLTQQLHRIDTEKLCWWLCERQLPNSGLNGRPEKLRLLLVVCALDQSRSVGAVHFIVPRQ